METGQSVIDILDQIDSSTGMEVEGGDIDQMFGAHRPTGLVILECGDHAHTNITTIDTLVVTDISTRTTERISVSFLQNNHRPRILPCAIKPPTNCHFCKYEKILAHIKYEIS